MFQVKRSLATGAILFVLGAPLLHCSSSTGAAVVDVGDGGDASACFPDHDGMIGGQEDTIELTVDDTSFSKKVISTQNSLAVKFTLKNTGTKPHGFKVECASVTSAYPDLPAGCPTTACFPSNSTIAPIAPGTSKTVTFLTPVPDNIIYPFESSDDDDSKVPGLNGSNGEGWSLM